MTQAAANVRQGTEGNIACFRFALHTALASLWLLATFSAFAQVRASLAGKVVDTEDRPQQGAKVTLHSGPTAPLVTTTGADGAFQLVADSGTHYTLEADTPTHLHGELHLSQPGELLRIVVRPAKPQMEFTDKPDFSIAGITDWTAVGGHGSDAVLRTSEDLARETRVHQDAGTLPAPDPALEAVLRKAVAMFPNDYSANYAMGEFLLHAHRPAEAIGFLERAVVLHGRAAADEYQAALAYEASGDLTKARLHVEVALKTNDAAAYHRLAGDLDERMGEPVSAVRELARATALDDSEASYFAWGSELLLHRAIWQAEEVFVRGAELHPDSERLKTGLVAALFAEARYDDAAERLCAAIDRDPNNRELDILLGKLALASPSMPACASSRVAAFLQRSPRDADANFYQASLLLKAGDRRRAAELFTTTVTLDPHFAEAHLQLGILEALQHDDVAAQRAYQQAISADPALPEPHYRLAVLYGRTGHQEQAKAEFALHARLIQEQASAVERERRQVKQFVVEAGVATGTQPSH